MSETRAIYGVSGLTGPNPSTLLRFDEFGYVPPTYLDVRIVTQRFNLTGSEVAQLTGVKTARTVRKWLAHPDALNHAPIPYAAWRLLLLEGGLVAINGIDAIRAGSTGYSI